MQQNALEHGRNGRNNATQVRQLEGQFNMMLDVSKKFCFSVTVDPDGPCNKLYALWLHSTLLGPFCDYPSRRLHRLFLSRLCDEALR